MLMPCIMHYLSCIRYVAPQRVIFKRKGTEGGLFTKGEGDRLVIRGIGGEDVSGGYREIREERDSHKESIKMLHDVSPSNLAITPSVFAIFWSDVSQIMVLNDGFKHISRGIWVETSTPFFICVHD